MSMWFRVATLCICIVSLGSFQFVYAQVMQSGSYQIQSDSINAGGGLSSSNNYITESTAGEIATGQSDSASFSLRAGYQQMQEVYLALSGGGNVVMDQSINGITGGTSNGSTTFTATTDSPGGYQLTIEASQSPAMQSSESTIADYVPVGAPPDLHFTTGAAESHFAYSPFGTHVVQRFLTNNAACNVGAISSSTACWDGLSTSAEVVSQSSGSNHPDGTDTTIYFKVGVGSSVVQTAGEYTATSTVTLISL